MPQGGRKQRGQKGRNGGRGGAGSKDGSSCGQRKVHFITAVVTHLGQRPSMEDEWVVKPCNDLVSPVEGKGVATQLFCGVYDGHAGVAAARFAQENVFDAFAKRVTDYAGRHTVNDHNVDTCIGSSFQAAYQEVDDAFAAQEKDDPHRDSGSGKKYSGSTALSLFFNGARVTAANAGDCRAIVIDDGDITCLSVDHRVSLESERQRILDAGGWISDDRLCGIMETVRGFGDIDFKEKKGEMFPRKRSQFTADLMVPTPDIVHHDLDIRREHGTWKVPYVVLASDGLWDLMTNQQVADALESPMATHIFPRLQTLADGQSPKVIDKGALQAVTEEFMSVVRQYAASSTEYMDNCTVCLILPVPCLDPRHHLDQLESSCVYCFSGEEECEQPTYEIHTLTKLTSKSRTARKKKAKGGKSRGGKRKR